MTRHFRNTKDSYGIVAIFLHWATALLVFGLFPLGLFITSIDYMHPWYKTAPNLHKSFGTVVFFLLLFRTAWTIASPRPATVRMPAWEHVAAYVVHKLLYALLFCVILSGYLIATADGRGIEVFGLFEVPAMVTSVENQEDLAGEVHFVLAITAVTLALLHALAALKHHFIDKDIVLIRMLGVGDSTKRP